MNKSPAYQWYPKDILGSARVAEMDLSEECAYRRALDYCWLNQSLPSDPAKLARIIGKGCTEVIAVVVSAMFIADPANPSRLIHERLEQERQKQAEWSRKSQEAGRKSAEARAEAKMNQKVNQISTTVDSTVEPKVNQSVNQKPTLQSASSSTSTNTEIKEGESGASAPALTIEKRKKDFEKSLAMYVDIFPPTMVRKFADYWSEYNRSKTKMRFELEKTWETSKRIRTWASRDNIEPKDQSQAKVVQGMSAKEIKAIWG